MAKGWNNKRGRAGNGRADTHVTAHNGRAVCFVTGQPSDLTVTLPPAPAEPKKAAPAGAKIMVGVRPGGACAWVFKHRQKGAQIQLGAEQLPVQPFQRRAVPASLAKDTDCFGALHTSRGIGVRIACPRWVGHPRGARVDAGPFFPTGKARIGWFGRRALEKGRMAPRQRPTSPQGRQKATTPPTARP